MAAWWFYHLERSRPELAAAPLIEKCLERDWRVLAVSPSERRRAELDEALWTFADGSFLPHGRSDGDGEAGRQPVLISPTLDNANGAKAALLFDGGEAPPDAPFERCMVMFEDGDAPVRAVARAQFKAAKDAGLEVRYFQQAGRGWKERT
ncbi:MAG: DNA polymerase III subunit chi [Pseudomonadota bacterium]